MLTLQKNISLAQKTNFDIGGPADYLCEAKTQEEVVEAIAWAQGREIPYHILGGGTNILVHDAGFRGLVIKIEDQKIEIAGERITCAAGAVLMDVVKLAIGKKLAGLENLYGIPGTVGGAIYGNAGAFGSALGDVVESVEVFDPGTQKVKRYGREMCQFGYRDSVFKENQAVIFKASLKLTPVKKGQILLHRIEEIKKIRSRHPYQRCAGSIFKNIATDDLRPTSVPVPPQCIAHQEVKVACLIDHAGLKGEKIGKAQVSREHANFIINTGQATAQDVLALIQWVQKEIAAHFSIKLKTEIQFLGFP